MPTLRIDGREVAVPPGGTVLDGARLLGIDIPALCHHVACTPNTSCLACVVRVNGAQRLVPSCATVAVDGMAVESETPDIRRARRTALELLLSDHAGDCLAPCERVCPAHLQIPIFLEHAGAGRMQEAAATILADTPLLGTLGWICPGLCEKGCRRGQLDDAISIHAVERRIAESALTGESRTADLGRPWSSEVARPTSAHRVAIIGAGPAGLSAAWHLLLAGHAVTIFDRRPRAGGTLRDLDANLLPPHVLDVDIQRVVALGADFRQGANIGREELARLAKEFDAVLLATGAPDGTTAALGLEADHQHIQVDASCRTNLAGVFATGACVAPQKYLVGALAQGRHAADAIDHHLRGVPYMHHPAFSVRSGALKEDERQEFLNRAASKVPPVPSPADCDLPSAGEGTGGTAEDAGRCVRCECQTRTSCTLRRAAEAYGADPAAFKLPRRSMKRIETHPAIFYEPGKCIACGICVQIAHQLGESVGLTFIGRGFQMAIGMPLDATLADALRDSALACAAACPTGALYAREEELIQVNLAVRR